jgi:AraC-like DNA-binding protein/mannose-6-phosphate isomerase-like protein (cupin superfamily)
VGRDGPLGEWPERRFARPSVQPSARRRPIFDRREILLPDADDGPAEASVRKTVAGYDDGSADHLVRELRIGSSVLCRSVMAAPWGFGIAGREVGSFHTVADGHGWLEVEGTDGPIEMRAGDFAVLPSGRPHWMRDSPGSTAPPLTSILAAHEVVDGELRFGSDEGPLTEVVCGVFSFEDGRRPGWVDRLPPVVASASDPESDTWRPTVIEALRKEAREPTAGGSLVVNRLLESLVADALRTALAGSLGDASVSTTALADGRIGRALARVHEDPARPWSVRALADVAMMSRSAFSDRFRALVGQSPMRYLTELRLRRAARLLRSTDATIADVARTVGYGSEATLSRAFKARFGEAPSVYRTVEPSALTVE